MKLSCLQENLSRGLGIVSRAVALRTTLPVTQNVLLATDQSRLKLAATNLEIAITTRIGAMVEQEGAMTVPARLLTEFVNTLPGEKIELELSSRPRGLKVTCGRTSATIHGTDAEDFPPIPAVDQGIMASVETSHLRIAIARVAFAAATEESRPVLTGVRVELEGEKLSLAAADGFRLAVNDGSLAKPVKESVQVIVPAKALQEVNRLLGDQKEPVELTVTPQRSQVLFRFEDVELVSQLIQGTFPNYRQLIPQSYQTRVTADLQAFQRAARTASIFARDGSGIVKLQLTPGGDGVPGKVTVSARAEEVGEHVSDFDAQVEGQEGKIAFNSKYLMDVLSVIDKQNVVLEITTPSSPGVFRMAGSTDYVHVVMPMFVQW